MAWDRAAGNEGRAGQDGADSPARLRAEVEWLRAALARAEARIAELEARADVDPLVDVLNRRGFEREIERSLAYVRRYGGQAALVYIDLDGFKAVNDAHGHAVGDAMLKAVAGALAGHVRASDAVGRLGGDEFGILMWNIGEPAARAKARELEGHVAAARLSDGDFQGDFQGSSRGDSGHKAAPAVGASAGLVMLAPDATAAAAIDAADRAMYARKRERRG